MHEFAKNVYGVRAFDQSGKELAVYRATPHQWNVAGHNGFVRFEYTLFGNHADGTYNGFDNRKAHMNMPATFVYGAGMRGRPVELHIDLSGHAGWKVATQLKSIGDGSYRAEDHDYFYDSPTIVGAFDLRSWQSSSNGETYTIELAMLHEGSDEDLDQYAEWVKKIVEEQKAVYGELPDFDFGRYTFLCSYNPWVHGDGMEHRNSTVCTAPVGLKYAEQIIGTVSHEFFHAWNVERIRPASLEPFNFDEANMSEALWFAEGFTSYYTDLILCRAGIRSPEAYIRGLAGRANTVINSPGRRHRSPVEMSYNAPFVDAATSVDGDNFNNTFISYYTYGAFIGLALDLTLRAGHNSSLDDFMRKVWEEHGKTEVPYTLPDLERILGELTGDPNFASRFFRTTIYGSEVPNMEALFKEFGIILRRKNPGRSNLSSGMEMTGGGARVNDYIIETDPLFEAGIQRGDLILEIDGKQLDSEETLNTVVGNMKIGNTYSIRYIQNGLEKEGAFTLGEDPTLEILPDENAGEAALQRRNAWLKTN